MLYGRGDDFVFVSDGKTCRGWMGAIGRIGVWLVFFDLSI